MAGASYGTAPTVFDNIRDEQVLHGEEILGPFRDEGEWELARWLMKNVGHNQAEQFLKLPIIQQRVHPAYPTKDTLLKVIDSLPGGVDWICKEMNQTGDLLDADGKPMSEMLELWYRDPVECVRELLGNPAFANVMHYTPERVYEDEERKSAVTDEMWTAEWWWETQGRLPMGSTVVPVILSSDKTKLSQFRGDKSAWPLYLTIGNISKDVRRLASSHATVLLGYLPVGKFDCFSDKARQIARYQMFHSCVRVVLDTLIQAGTSGENMTCADRNIRSAFPIVAAYVADYPEQCLVSCCMENRCPVGTVRPEDRGAHLPCLPRSKEETLQLLRDHQCGQTDPESKQRFKDIGLRPVYSPFWADLPHTDIFQSFTPDLLHQLHKGVFKDHLVKWCTSLVGADEIDDRFRTMPSLTGLRQFKNGISSVSQWTGAEHKEMEKIFVGMLASAVDVRVIQAVRALLDFIYLASLQSHTTETIRRLRAALDDFHTHKDIFLETGARHPAHFNIPKYHAMEHYPDLILRFGSTDGYNTEWSERLHIDYAKDAYRASNKKDYTVQMTRWLSRQEAIDRFGVYLECSDADIIVSRSDSQPQDHEVAVNHQDDIHCNCTVSIKKTTTYRIVLDHNASQFLHALQTFLRGNGSLIIPQPFDRFDLFKCLVFHLPDVAEANSNKLLNIVRAAPPVPRVGRRAAHPAYLDFALLRTGEGNTYTDGTPMHGLRVAHVRVIFKLPKVFNIETTHPLAYVEWFTPFRAPDKASGLHIVSPSTRMHQPYAEIVEVNRIVRNCHLIPKYGAQRDPLWSAENVTVLDICKSFYVNPYIDLHAFSHTIIVALRTSM
ncbi:hypothetical protein B0H21DRAFT_778363 [Amylocystis lapponica]|nr:hypothetical protein B0H21DRAFT_778363 [Amylocystis lapponica]